MDHARINNLYKRKASKYYGVSLYKNLRHKNKPWGVQIRGNKKRIQVGSYKTELEAARAYNEYVIKYNLDRPLNSF